jgi:hypothetical protein
MIILGIIIIILIIIITFKEEQGLFLNVNTGYLLITCIICLRFS